MMPDVAYPIEAKSDFYALLETQGSRSDHDQEVSRRWLMITVKIQNLHIPIRK